LKYANEKLLPVHTHGSGTSLVGLARPKTKGIVLDTARMKDVVNSMNRLEEQSREIDEIVQTIEKISGKTNILSLNAGIEAVKAGSEGTRFGVVAREIRLLAQDSRQSALHITGNIERIRETLDASLTHAEDGEQAVTSGKEVMTQMTEHFEKILNASINAARELKKIEGITSHQAETNRRLSDFINQIKKDAQEKTTAAEKMHSTLKSLDSLLARLQSQTQQNL